MMILHRQADLRMFLPKISQQRKKDLPVRTADAGRRQIHPLLRVLKPERLFIEKLHPLCDIHKRLSGRRHPDLLLPFSPQKKFRPQLFFKRHHPLSERWLGHITLFCGSRDTPRLNHIQKRPYTLHIHDFSPLSSVFLLLNSYFSFII